MFYFIIGLFVSWGQKETELKEPPKFIAAPKEKLPSLIAPKKK